MFSTKQCHRHRHHHVGMGMARRVGGLCLCVIILSEVLLGGWLEWCGVVWCGGKKGVEDAIEVKWVRG